MSQFLTPDELAERWKISVRTIENWRSNNKGPKYVQIGGPNGKVRYLLKDIEEYENGKKVGS